MAEDLTKKKMAEEKIKKVDKIENKLLPLIIITKFSEVGFSPIYP